MRVRLGIILVVLASLLVPVLPSQEADAATWKCGWAQTQRYGVGSVTGTNLAVHFMRSDYCWTTTSTKDGAITDHRAWAMGWTQWAMEVNVTGKNANKVGQTYHHVGYAQAKACITGKLGLICGKSDHYIKHYLKPNGKVSKENPSWNV